MMTRRIFGKILLVVVAVLGLLALSGVLQAGGNSGAGFDRVKAVQEAHTDRLMAIPGVVGTAIGLDESGGHVVTVLLERPGVKGIAKKLNGITVKTVVTGKINALSDPTAWFTRPVPIGVSTGHPDITAGTIGCRVIDEAGNVYALSNNHVFANQNNASIGDAVIQPGTYDKGTLPDDAIGTLAVFEPIVFSRRAKNVIDAAIVLSSDGDLPGGLLDNATPIDGYGTPNSDIVDAFIGQLVQKFGRTTGLTKGEVRYINVTVNIGYGPGQTAKFVKQIIIEDGSFSAGGDSGSLIVTDDENLNPVGLLFAGSSTHTIANRIDLVLDRFGVTVDGQTPTSNDAPSVSITSPADGATFDTGDTITLSGNATDTEDDNGTLTASLVWTSGGVTIGTGGSDTAVLSDGYHTITASATDSGGKTTSASVDILVGSPPEEATAVIVDSITYAIAGGRNGDKNLLITVALVDDLGGLVGGASVSIRLYRDGSSAGSGSGTTGTSGTVTFNLRNAKSGAYTTDVTAVTAAGLTWDETFPANDYEK